VAAAKFKAKTTIEVGTTRKPVYDFLLVIAAYCSNAFCVFSHPLWRDALETVINSRKLSDALGNPSTQRQITVWLRYT